MSGVTEEELEALPLDEEAKTRVEKRFALWCAGQAVGAWLENDWPRTKMDRRLVACLLAMTAFLDGPTEAGLARLNRRRNMLSWNDLFNGCEQVVVSVVYSMAVIIYGPFCRMDRVLDCVADIDSDEQRAALAELVLAELARSARQDWRPEHGIAEDYYAR